MGYIKEDFENLKGSLSELIGEEILIIEPISKRGKRVGKLATLENTYGDYFRVRYEDEQATNYNYVDIFTKDIKIKTYNGEEFNSLDVPRPLTKKESIPSLDMSKYEQSTEDDDDFVGFSDFSY